MGKWQKIVGTLDVSAVEQAGTATASDIASGKTAWVNKTKITGTVPVISRQDKTLSAGQTYTIPYGIHGGNTVITAKSLANETVGTATADNILKDKTAWVNGVLVTGTFDLDEHIRDTLSATDAEKASVLSGKKFYSATYGYIAIGEMANNSAAPDRLLSPGETYTIAKGYYDGTTQISAKTMSDLTPGSAHAEHIIIILYTSGQVPKGIFIRMWLRLNINSLYLVKNGICFRAFYFFFSFSS